MIYFRSHKCLTLVFQLICLCCFMVGFSQSEPSLEHTFPEGFKSKYNSNTYSYEGEHIVTKTPPADGEIADYNDKKPDINETKDNTNFDINLSGFAWLFYTFLGIAVIVIVYLIIQGNTRGLFSNRSNKKINTNTSITAENIEHADIKSLISKAENEQNYNLAIRYYYLLVLKHLSLKKHIIFEDDKTNADYIQELDSSSLSKPFNYASYIYNYMWYGKFSVDTTNYTAAKQTFNDLLKQI